MNPEMITRAAAAKLNTGAHIHPPETREEFAQQMLAESYGTITTAEIDSLYAEKLDFWEAVKAMPGVELAEHGCAYMPNPQAPTSDDVHASTDADPAMPDTVEALLNAANTNHGGPVVMTIEIIATSDGYGAAINYNPGLDMEKIGSAVTAMGETLKTQGNPE